MLQLWQARASHLFAAASLLVLSGQLLRTWIDPMAIENGAWVRFGVGLLLLEFLFVHSAPFTAVAVKVPGRQRIWAVLGLLAFYSLFAAGMILAVKEPRLALVYFGVMAARIWSGWSDAQSDELAMGAWWALSVVVYLGSVFASVLLPWPHLGLPPELGARILDSGGGGVWEAEPHRAIAAGAMYFAVLAAVEVVRALAVKLKPSPEGQTQSP
jgi:hypothetical protein